VSPLPNSGTTVLFVPGQRWISITEPELGLGEITRVGPRRLSMSFPAARETRDYASTPDAPLRRAAFHVGDTVTTRGNVTARVDRVLERDGLLYYGLGGTDICETELSPRLGFDTPLRRLYAEQFDDAATFDHRLTALEHQFDQRRSTVRGLAGARIDLLLHQLGIASEVSGRLRPRVLLADEVGLGKTIEACLIVHRLLLTGRAQRVLVLVPETIVHQWFLELLRRFNLWFHIFTEARCTAIEEAAPGANPFADDQLVLCELTWLVREPRRLEQAIAAGWDVVVVDEAHHLGWTPESASPEYAAVEQLACISPGLLLLTATPEQLGRAGHFARLRLLDPDRFHDLEAFLRETAAYQDVARIVDMLKRHEPLEQMDRPRLASLLAVPEQDIVTLEDGDRADDGRLRTSLIEQLLDLHGTSRVMFRNTRATVGGFPRRIAGVYPLDANRGQQKALAAEWADEHGEPRSPSAAAAPAPRSIGADPRLPWLLSLLQSLGDQKVLLICRTPQKVKAIDAALRERTSMPFAAFHEDLSLIQRDRGAAWFADPDGARLLVASEIGSEGRNFQFAHHLVLFDLPLDPALLEQRLGRLDRIGQRHDIVVHVPSVAGTHLEVLARWYHEGLDAFEHHLPGARELMDRFEPGLRATIARMHDERRSAGATDRDGTAHGREIDALLDDTRRTRREVAARLESGRDRLLEWNSARTAAGRQTAERIRAADEDRALDRFMLLVFDLFFIEVEEIAPRTFRLGSAGVLADEFPGLKSEGVTVTRDRARALVREDLQFLTWDHPLATGALDLLLGSEKGNCAFAQWIDPAPGLYLEAIYVLEPLAPRDLHVDRFLPPTPVRVVVDRRGREAASLPLGSLGPPTHPGLARALLSRADVRDSILPRMVEGVAALADVQTAAVRTTAAADMRTQLQFETDRLRDLQRVNRLVRDEEIDLLLQQQATLAEVIGSARVRLDALRLIYRGPQR
jgi:ATP-dependent helicase HepA